MYSEFNNVLTYVVHTKLFGSLHIFSVLTDYLTRPIIGLNTCYIPFIYITLQDRKKVRKSWGGTLMFLDFCVPFLYISNFCKSRQTGYQMKAQTLYILDQVKVLPCHYIKSHKNLSKRPKTLEIGETKKGFFDKTVFFR